MTSTTNQTEQLNQTITEENEAFEQLPFTVHLIELRRRLIKCVGLIIALFLVILPRLKTQYDIDKNFPHPSKVLCISVFLFLFRFRKDVI